MTSVLPLLIGTLWAPLAAWAGPSSEDDGAGEEREDPPSTHEDDDADWSGDEVIVVTGLGREEDARRSQHHTRVISGEVLRDTGAQSLADALETQPGVQLVDLIGGEGIRLQGLDPEHTLILIDGVRVGGRVGGTLDLRRIPVADIEQVEIVEGPSATLYGSDAVAGVVHIRTRRARPGVRGEIGLGTGRYLSPVRAVDDSVDRAIPVDALDTVDATAALDLGGDTTRGRLQAAWSGSEATDLLPEDPGTAINAFRQLRLSGTGDVEVAPGHTWHTQALWQSFRRWGVDSLPTGATLDRTNLTSEWGLSGGPTIELDDRRKIEILVGGRGWTDQYRVDQRGADTQDAYQRTVDVLGQARVKYDTVIGERHVVSVGGEFLGEHLQTDRIDPKQVDRTRIAAFAQERWDVLGDDSLSIEGALRGDMDTRFGSYVTPRGGLRYAPSERVLVRLSGGRGFRAPDFREMFLIFENAASGYRVEGTEDLRPETSWNLQGGVEVSPAEPVRLAARGFYNTLQDLIQADLADSGGPGQLQTFAYVNIASAWTAGGELEVDVQDADIGGLGLVYRFTETLDRGTELPLSGRARHQISGQGRLALPFLDGQLLARGTWMGPRAFVRSSGDELIVQDAPAFLQLDLSLRVRPHDRLDVVLGVENLADAGADPETLLQTRPRRGFLRLDARFGQAPTQDDTPNADGVNP